VERLTARRISVVKRATKKKAVLKPCRIIDRVDFRVQLEKTRQKQKITVGVFQDFKGRRRDSQPIKAVSNMRGKAPKRRS